MDLFLQRSLLLSNKFRHIIFIATTPLIGVFAVFMTLVVSAQQDTVTNKTQQLNDLVVTGQFGENSLSKSVYKMRVIDAKKFKHKELLIYEMCSPTN